MNAHNELKPNTDIATEINQLHGKLIGYMKKSVQTIFEIGKLLDVVKNELDHGEFTPWIEENCNFNIRSAQRYLKVFERFKNDTVSFLKDQTITEAYIEAGIKKIAPENSEETTELVPALEPDEALEQGWIDAVFRAKAEAADLKRYRVHVDPNTVYMTNNVNRTPMPVANIHLAKHINPQLEPAYNRLQKELQFAFERYLFELEQLEETGMVKPPEDMRLSTMRKKLAKKEVLDASFEEMHQASAGREDIA